MYSIRIGEGFAAASTPEGLIRTIQTLPHGEYDITESISIWPRTISLRWGVAILPGRPTSPRATSPRATTSRDRHRSTSEVTSSRSESYNRSSNPAALPGGVARSFAR